MQHLFHEINIYNSRENMESIKHYLFHIFSTIIMQFFNAHNMHNWKFQSYNCIGKIHRYRKMPINLKFRSKIVRQFDMEYVNCLTIMVSNVKLSDNYFRVTDLQFTVKHNQPPLPKLQRTLMTFGHPVDLFRAIKEEVYVFTHTLPF